jgi:hypothetical protein
VAGRPKTKAKAVAADAHGEQLRKRLNKQKRRRNQRLIRDLVAVAEPWSFKRPLDLGCAELWGELLGHAVVFMRFAHQQAALLTEDEFWVRKVDAQGNILVEPHPWVQFAAACRAEVAEIANKMESLDIDTRRLAANEATAEAFVAFFNTVTAELKLSAEQRKQLVETMRSYQSSIEGSVAA